MHAEGQDAARRGVADVEVGENRQRRIAHHLDDDPLVLLEEHLVHGLAAEHARHGPEHPRALQGLQHAAVVLRAGALLAGFQQQNLAPPVVQRGEQPVPFANGHAVGVAVMIEDVIEGLQTATQNLPMECGCTLEQLEALVCMALARRADGARRPVRALIIPYVAGRDLPDAPGAQQLPEVPRRVGQHFVFHLAHVRQEGLAVECVQPQFVQHQVIHRGIGKAQEDFRLQRPPQRIVFKQMRREAVGVVPADGAEDHVDGLILKGLNQILRALLRVVPYIFNARLRVGHHLHVHAVGRKPLQADVHLVLYEVLADGARRQAHDCDIPYHMFPLLRSSARNSRSAGQKSSSTASSGAIQRSALCSSSCGVPWMMAAP